MSHDHHHHCLCNHNNLAYCSACLVVYCKDCKKEWIERTSWITYSNYPNWGNFTNEPFKTVDCQTHQ
jgi:hypothetical protein